MRSTFGPSNRKGRQRIAFHKAIEKAAKQAASSAQPIFPTCQKAEFIKRQAISSQRRPVTATVTAITSRALTPIPPTTFTSKVVKTPPPSPREDILQLALDASDINLLEDLAYSNSDTEQLVIDSQPPPLESITIVSPIADIDQSSDQINSGESVIEPPDYRIDRPHLVNTSHNNQAANQVDSFVTKKPPSVKKPQIRSSSRLPSSLLTNTPTTAPARNKRWDSIQKRVTSNRKHSQSAFTLPKVDTPPRRPPSPVFARFNPGLVCPRPPVQTSLPAPQNVIINHYYPTPSTLPSPQRNPKPELQQKDARWMNKKQFKRWATQMNKTKPQIADDFAQWRREHKIEIEQYLAEKKQTQKK